MDIRYGNKLSKTCQNCGGRFSSMAYIDGERKSLQYRKYCLECSPYKSGQRGDFRWKTIGGVRHKLCSKCKKYKPVDSDFVFDRSVSRHKSECKHCAAQRLREHKQRAVEYKGGRCLDCDQAFPACVFDFHHRNPDSKDFMIGSGSKDWTKIKAELDKCDLLCANCHRLRHSPA